MKIIRYLFYELKYQRGFFISMAILLLIYNTGDLAGLWNSIGFFNDINSKIIFIFTAPIVKISEFEKLKRPILYALLPIKIQYVALIRLLNILLNIAIIALIDLIIRKVFGLPAGYELKSLYTIIIYLIIAALIALYSDFTRIFTNVRYKDIKVSLSLSLPLLILISVSVIFNLKQIILITFPALTLLLWIVSFFTYTKRKTLVR